MKYKLTGITKWDVRTTELYVFHDVWLVFAEIRWSREKRSSLFLNSKNISQLSGPVADNLDLLSKDAMPVFSQIELQTVVDTVKTQLLTEQAKQRPGFNFIRGEAESVASVADLVLKAVVQLGEKTEQGLLIECVAVPWFEIIEVLKKDPTLAFKIPPRKWEEIIAGAYKRAGFDEVTLTPSSGDFGRDVIAVKRGLGIVRVIDQVKAYKPGHLVTANDVRALFGVVTADHASKGFLTTTSDFAPKLKDDPLLQPFIPSRLELINGTTLLKRLEDLTQPKNKL